MAISRPFASSGFSCRCSCSATGTYVWLGHARSHRRQRGCAYAVRRQPASAPQRHAHRALPQRENRLVRSPGRLTPQLMPPGAKLHAPGIEAAGVMLARRFALRRGGDVIIWSLLCGDDNTAHQSPLSLWRSKINGWVKNRLSDVELRPDPQRSSRLPAGLLILSAPFTMARGADEAPG